jgi:hypothetical protein
MKRIGILVAISAVCAIAAGLAGAAPKPPATQAVDAAGDIHVPSDYASRYEYLGTWAVAADKVAGSSQMHIVYASPGAIAAFKKSGHFPERTVLVKEVRDTETGPMTTGTVSRPTKLKGWFVAVRDTKNSHPDNKLWGDGWGWSWFDADKPLHTTSTDLHKDCEGCHRPAQATDWMYTPGYTTLQH